MSRKISAKIIVLYKIGTLYTLKDSAHLLTCNWLLLIVIRKTFYMSYTDDMCDIFYHDMDIKL